MSSEDDILGFPLPPRLTAAQKEDRQRSLTKWQSQQDKWTKYTQRQALSRSKSRLKQLIRQGGVPPEQRTWVWLEVSGARRMKETKPLSYFENLVIAGEATSSSRQQIELDLPRTFPEHAWLHGREGQSALRSILLAYSMHNARAGYCQGLNFVAGTLLLATDRQPETAFWLLIALIENILYTDMYGPYLPGFLIEMKALGELVQDKLPDLHRHLESVGCELSILATDWFMCLYVTSLPHETAVRVLDCLFLEGSKILYRVALAILKVNKAKLLKCDNAGELIPPLKEAVSQSWSVDALLKTAFNKIGSLSMTTIWEYREKHRGPIEASTKEREMAQEKRERDEAARTRQLNFEKQQQPLQAGQASLAPVNGRPASVNGRPVSTNGRQPSVNGTTSTPSSAVTTPVVIS